MSIGEHRLALPAGYALGKYHFIEVLGSGGFGITYLAEDRSLNRRVAIKELLPNDIATRIDGTTVAAKTKGDEESLEWARERFVNEGRALAACEHPNVVHVYEIIESNGTAYMVTKYEEGCSLEKWLRDLGRAPDETELRGILMPLLSGLEKVHTAGFLHRDIKPENIYITTGGRPLLLDFGSARQAVSNRSMAMTSIVTSGYAPFEQYYEDGNQGPWRDIYALGAVVYRAVTGKKPPESTRRLKDDPCEKLSARFAGQFSPGFLRAIDRALSVNETKRPQSIGEWRGMLGDDQSEAATILQKKQPHRQPGPADWIRRRPWAGPAAIAAVVAAVALIWGSSRPKPVPPEDHKKILPHATATPVADSGSTPAPPGPVQKPTPQPPPGPQDSPAPQPAPTPDAAPDTTLDSRIIGSWQTGSTRTKRAHLDLWANGCWQVWGPVNDSGTFTASNGRLRQFSDITQQWQEASYQFEDDTLVILSPLGSATWHRTGTTSDGKSTTQKHRSGSQEHESTGREILNHFIRGRGF